MWFERVKKMKTLDETATEADLIERAQFSLSRCNWELGACAAQWTRRFARGRSDGDFGLLIGLSADQVYQRRRTWETFADVYTNYPTLKWSHFYVSLNWDDAAECLQWATEVHATVSEMKAWRRAQRGEELTSEADHTDSLQGLPAEVRIPMEEAPFDGGVAMENAGGLSSYTAEMVPVVAAVARNREETTEYTPFHQGAITPPRSAAGEKNGRPAEESDPEMIVKRLTTAMERCAATLNNDFMNRLENLPEKVRLRLWTAAEHLSVKLAQLIGD